MTRRSQGSRPRGPSALFRGWRARRARGRQPDLVGHGLWQRVHEDCVTAARRAPTLTTLLPAVRALAEEGQRRWPSDTLDVPAAADGRAHYERLRGVQKAFRDVAYRARLTLLDASDSRQPQLLEGAAAEARRLLAEPGPGSPTPGDRV